MTTPTTAKTIRDGLGATAAHDPVLWMTVDYGTFTLDVIAKSANGAAAEWMYDHLQDDAYEFITTASGRKINRRYIIEARLVPQGGYTT